MKKNIVLLLLPFTLVAQKNYPALLDDYAKAEFKVNGFNGNVLVMQKGKAIYRKSFGMADREWNVPNTAGTKFRIGSLTKQFTSVCILNLAEQGKLDLNDKLSKYIPDYPKGDSITIHMLLNHTSGIKDYVSIPEFWKKVTLPLSQDSMIAMFKNKPLDFPAGTQWKYSSSGYLLLGMIIEKISGKGFSDYLQENVIRKAGLKNTTIDNQDSVLAFRAKGYWQNPLGIWYHARYINMESSNSAVAMISTTEDLYLWTRALMNNQIISAESTQKMLTPHLSNYGYGIVIDSLENHRRIWHNGNMPGFSSHLAYYPSDDVCVVTISNNERNSENLGVALASIMFDLPVQKPYTSIKHGRK